MNKIVISVLTASLVAGCAHHMETHGDADTATIPLVWKPTTSMATAGTRELTGKAPPALRIEVTDSRSELQVIGRNTEKLQPRMVTTPDNVAAFVSKHVAELIDGTGVTEVNSNGTLLLKTEVVHFFVEETEIYSGDVRLKVTLIDGGGNALWTGITNGASVRFGRSFSAENYEQTLSDSLVEAVRNLMQSSSFRRALAGDA
ncbi:MAG: hypothetical protein ABI648_02280 [Betaproteobacteria bacterium]